MRRQGWPGYPLAYPPGGYLPGSFLPGGSSQGIVYPASGAEWADWANHTDGLTAYWRFTRPDAGDEVDLVGTADLSPITTPTQGVFDADLNSVCVEFDAANRRMQAADSSVLETSINDFLYWEVFRCPVVTDTNLRSMAGKRDPSSPNAGWDLFLEFDAAISITLDGGVLTDADSIGEVSGTTPRMVCFVCDRNAGILRIHLWRDGAVVSGVGDTILAAVDLLGSGIFGLGRSEAAGTTASPRVVSAAGMIIGTGARGFGATNLAALAASMGMP